MTVREATLIALRELRKPVTYVEVYEYLKHNGLCTLGGKTPISIVSAQLGDFIRKGDSRIKRAKFGDENVYRYYLSEFEDEIDFEEISSEEEVLVKENKTNLNSTPKRYNERDLHLLLSTYLKKEEIYRKTIFHERSMGKNNHQKWLHPDMVGVRFTKLRSDIAESFMKLINRGDTFEFISYELKKELRNDYELKKSYFQAVSNSSWANRGYLVAFEINDNLREEMERLNNAFGIGIIHLKANPFESKVLFTSKYRELDFRTIDKICNINRDFLSFFEKIEKLLSADKKYINSVRKELEESCDDYLKTEDEIEKYCKDKNIPMEE